MKVKVLGCSGSESIGHRTPGFLGNDRVILDAGTISAALSIESQSRITDIFVSHTHLDHIKGLLFMADNVIGRITRPVNIRAIPKVIEAIKKHLMNDLIWPDFTKIPTPKAPVLASKPLKAGSNRCEKNPIIGDGSKSPKKRSEQLPRWLMIWVALLHQMD